MERVKSSRTEYVNTIEYRMVFILSGYRNILLLQGTDFLRMLREYRFANDRSSGLSANTILAIDAGFAKLNMDEVRLYSDYIAKIMNYDENVFFDCLKEKVNSFDYDDEDGTKMAKCRIRIMHQIDKNMV